MKNKTVFFIGAGSTAKLKIPTTEQQIDIFDTIKADTKDLLGKLKIIVEELFGRKGKKLNCTVNDIYNTIDSNLLLHCGLYTKKIKIEHYELEQCKMKLVTFLFKKFRDFILKIPDEDYAKYIDFYYHLAKKELEEKQWQAKKAYERDFFVASYSIVNLNWDLLSIMPIIEAHNKLNHENDHYLPIQRNPSLRIYTDFNCEFGSKNDGKNESIWYPFTESAASIANSEKYDTTRRVVLTKCFYPHGSMNLFKCPKCAKHSYYLGNLKLKGIAKDLNYDEVNREVYKCPYCGNSVHVTDFDALIQSNFKTRNSYLEEIRLSMINELRDAKTLVFIGYSMPNDDVDYKTMFKSLGNVEKVYVVLKSDVAENKFITENELTDEQRKTVENYLEIFDNGKRELYFNFAGVPNAFKKIIHTVN